MRSTVLAALLFFCTSPFAHATSSAEECLQIGGRVVSLATSVLDDLRVVNAIASDPGDLTIEQLAVVIVRCRTILSGVDALELQMHHYDKECRVVMDTTAGYGKMAELQANGRRAMNIATESCTKVLKAANMN